MKLFIFLITSFLFCSCVSTDFFENNISSDFEKNKSEEIFLPEESLETLSFESKIYIKTEYPKANVYLNNNFQGKSPLLIENVIPGFYFLKIEYLDMEKSIVKKEYMIEVVQNRIQNYYISYE